MIKRSNHNHSIFHWSPQRYSSSKSPPREHQSRIPLPTLLRLRFPLRNYPPRDFEPRAVSTHPFLCSREVWTRSCNNISCSGTDQRPPFLSQFCGTLRSPWGMSAYLAGTLHSPYPFWGVWTAAIQQTTHRLIANVILFLYNILECIQMN